MVQEEGKDPASGGRCRRSEADLCGKLHQAGVSERASCVSFWQDILLGLDQLPVVTPYGKTMIGDLKQLLTEKGFVAFDGFTWSKTEVEETLYYDFG